MNGKTTKNGKIETKTEEEIIEPTEPVEEEEITEEIEEVFIPTEEEQKLIEELEKNINPKLIRKYDSQIKNYYPVKERIYWLQQNQKD